ncbi:MAG: hypothetical protein MUC50_08000 [Myxococcota bacterium]|nr:hypothetical protein [Myxococcota bacterium]
MKKLFALMIAALFALSIIACGDDEAACTEDDVTECIDAYTACGEETDADAAACLSEYCDCLDGGGCNIPEGAGCD